MMYPSTFILVFMTMIEEFIDSLVSGGHLGEEAISSVAIGWPGVAIINVVGIPINIFGSIAGIEIASKINPEYAIAGLVWGYFVSTLFQVIALLIVKKKKNIKLSLCRPQAHFKDYVEIFKYGFPEGINFFIDSAICSIINLILVQNIGEIALSYYLIFQSVILLGRVAADTGGQAGAPLFGLLVGAKDKNGLKTALRESIIVSLLFTLAWGFLLFLSLPVLIPEFGAEVGTLGYEVVRRGIIIGLILMPTYLILKCLTNFYQAAGHFKLTLVLSVIPDSIIYPLSLFLLINTFSNKYDTLWITYSGCYILFILIAYIIHVIKTKKLSWKIDDILLIKDDFKENVLFDFSTTTETNEKNATISANVINFLKEQKYSDRVANMCGLCIEELNADFMQHVNNSKKDKRIEKEVMDMKLISDNGNLHMIIRNVARPYNPLDFEYNKDDFSKLGVMMVQKFAKKIEYSYIYKMNVITIDF